ncbi:pilus assembly protein TadG-related protein [Aquisediminimonas profunda]|uniref:pilus assembly protein TadG-related protein n=1 Tax=Aquisediminimonas profunda TaxID=1550733 RepID=UPI001FE7BB2A|nr:pilus assembly protein TadG-related protein [Aquisediminimonas profunda]
MLRSVIGQGARNESGAVASTVALSLFGLIAVGGLAVDYARMAALDTELQQAADQAALAAASQLNGQSGACSRAVIAARDLLENKTKFGNDGGGYDVTIPNQTANSGCGTGGDKIKFYSAYTNNSSNTVTTDPLAAKFVSVTVNTRKAVYALTPIMALFNSTMGGTAVAGLGSAICKVPPVMICNPQETGGNTSFDAAGLIGKGLKLVSVGNGGSWAPGNFGYLNTGGGSNGAPGLREALGWTAAPGDCLPQTGVDTKPGATVSVTDALNTRFDIYDSNQSCPSGGNCPASINSVKDLLRPNNANGNNACRIHNSGWQEASPDNKLYLPNSTNALTPSTLTPDVMGHPRDMCHAADSGAANYCSGPIGTGAWDRDTYFRTNYGWNTSQWQANVQTGSSPIAAPASATRYQVYSWEIANRGSTIGGVVILSTRSVGSLRDHDAPVCSNIQTPSYGTGTVPGATTVDRRRISVAVVNCTANSVNGASTNVPVAKWVDVFLVEPSLNRGAASSGTHARSGTNAGDVYVEVIGETASGAAGQTAGQVIRRDKPYLIE